MRHRTPKYALGAAGLLEVIEGECARYHELTAAGDRAKAASARALVDWLTGLAEQLLEREAGAETHENHDRANPR